MKKEFITNLYNPYAADAVDHIVKNDDEAKRNLLFKIMLEKLSYLEVADPQETDVYKREELEAMNIVGIYSKDDTPKHIKDFFASEIETKKSYYEPENVSNEEELLAEKIAKVELDIDYP